MWRTGVVLFVGCLAAVLALPAVKEDIVLVAETENKHEISEDKPARVARSFADNVVHAALSRAVGDIYADTNNAIEMATDGHTLTLTFGNGKNVAKAVPIKMLVSLEDDPIFVYDIACTGTCTKTNGQIKDYYSPNDNGVQQATGTDGNLLSLTYTVPDKDQNQLSGAAYRDSVSYTSTEFASDFLFAAINNGDATKNGLQESAEGYLGLGFPQPGATMQFNTLGALLKKANSNYVTIQRNDNDSKGTIAIGQDKFAKCNYNRTSTYQKTYYNPTTKVQKWWFSANALIDSINETVYVKVDLTSDSIGLPKKYLDIIGKNGGNTTDNSVSDFSKLPTLKLVIGDNVLVINSTVYTSTSNGKSTLMTVEEPGKDDYKIVLGAPFLRYFCTILYQKGNDNKIAFTLPDDPPATKFAHVSSISFLALALVPLVNFFRF